MDIVISIAGKIGEYLVAPIGRQFGYVLFYKSHVGDFKKKVEELEDKKVEVEGLVNKAKGNGDFILPTVTKWLEGVDNITKESESIFLSDEAQASKRCFKVPFPDYKLRYNRGRKATKNTKKAIELQQSGSFEGVSLSVGPPTTRFKSTEEVEDFQSRKATLNEVMKAIKDPKVKIIGIYGIGGVGKTTLVKQVAEQGEVRNQFEKVVMAVVSQTLNLEKIQQQIAEMLGLKFEGESQLGRAERLNSGLKKIERVLIILDDIWSRVKLGDIGIPFGVEHEGCKIVITSRSQDVCNQMATQRNVEVGILVKEEAWNLFRKMVGDVVDSPQRKLLASKVVKRCSGLPIAIVTIARALKDKSLSFWKDAANGSRMSKEVSSTLQLSYDYLESEEAKSLFLLCSIYGEDYNIDIEDLWKYSFSMGLFKGLNSVERARDRVYALAEYLKYSCFLQEGSNKDYVKMHDVLRDFAISVASKDEHGFLVRSDQGWNEFPDSSQFIRYTTISLISDVIQKLPDDMLECRKLELLYLECTHPSLQIPDKFFSGMKKLKVLVMSNMNFKPFSLSLVDLENLQTLCLRDCNLKNADLSVIGKLKGLKFLSFIGSNIKKLPKEIGELNHLKLLDLSDCSMLKIIPRDVILRLSELEGLYMGGTRDYTSFTAWNIEGQNTTRGNVSIGDLKHLPVLTSLKIVVRDQNCLPDSENSLFKNLARFNMCIGFFYKKEDDILYSKALKLMSLSNNIKLILSTSFKTTEYLYLEFIKHGLGSVLYDLEGESVLKCLIITSCDELEYVFNTKDSVLPATVSNLEKLDLSRLPNLKGISHGQLSNVCFRNLRVVKVNKCDGLKYLFSHFKATDLQQLSELRVIECEIMEEIFGDEIGASLLESIVFPSLQVLELSSLPKLINFCSKTKCTDTHMENPLFHEKVMFPLLEKLEISMINVKDIWDHQLPGNFKNLSSIRIYKCDGLKSLFRSSMASSFGQLQEVVIDSCDNMETIISKERDVDEESCMEKVIVFPQLCKLTLSDLPNLASFYQTACPTNKLEDLTQPLPLFGEKVMFPVLEKLQISTINVKDIWDHDHQLLDNFKNLSSVNIYKCNSLKSLFQSSMASSLGQLHEVVISSCEIMETIISKERDGNKENCMENIIVFSQLRKLTLESLSNLASFTKEDLTQPQPLLDGKVAFPALEELRIQDLRNLKSLFSPSVIRSLEHLQKVDITNCNSMETVIANEKQGEEDCMEMINVFSQLRDLELKYLPSFTSFYLGTSTLIWPSLKLLRIHEIANKLDHCLFNKKVLFPSLEKLVLAGIHNLKEIWPPQIPANFFSQLKVLEVDNCSESSSVVSSSLLPYLQSLEKLYITDCDLLEEVVNQVEGHEVNELIFPHLRDLKLETLPELKHIMCWDKYKQGTLAFQSLISVEITECDSLKSLIPHSVASTLVQLQQLSISSCEQMETVVAKERPGEENCLNWPSLKSLEIADCPAMKRFTGNISCPQNHQVLSKEAPEPGRPCPFFHSQVALTSLEILYINNMKNVEEIFDNQLSDESLCQLKELCVDRCNKLLRVVPSNLLPKLKKLQQLFVTNCNLVEEISEQGLEEGQATTISFTRLEKVEFENLPNLKIFFSGKYEIKCPSLYRIILDYCPKIETFSSGFTSAPVLKTISLEGITCRLKDDLNTTIQLFHEKELLAMGGGLGGEESSNEKSPSEESSNEELSNEESPSEESSNEESSNEESPSEESSNKESANEESSSEESSNEESSNELDSGSVMKDDLQNPEGGISNNSLNCMASEDNSTSMKGSVMEENPLTLEMGGSGDIEDHRSVHQNIDLTNDAGVVSGNKPSRKRSIISSEEKGKAKVLDEGSEKVSHMTATSSHQLPSSSGILIRRSAMKDPQTLKVDGYIDVANTDIFPDDIARRPLGDQNVHQNTNPGKGFVTPTENNADADMSTQDIFLLGGANHTHPDEMFNRYQAETESLQRDRNLLRHRVETLEDLLNHTRTDEMVTGYTAEAESLQRDRELMRQRVETLEDSLSHAHTNEMVVRSLQKNQDMLRQRVETLEDLLVTGNHGGKVPGASLGLNTTLDVGWAAWSLCLIFVLLYFFAHYSQLLFVHLKH